MKVIIDKEMCIGCGLCASICPEVFEMGDDGKAKVIEKSTKSTLNAVQEAVDSCPVSAISEE